ncbi:MAG: NAD(P)-binding protein [Gemmatimonas sp.]|nr:NAD(P)-binding protein [Gemmatimonas sp.]
MTSIAIVGSGLSGLTVAHALQARGHSVVVYESEERVGGRMLTDRLGDTHVDAGAQLFGSMYTRFLALVEEIGLQDRLVQVPGRDALWRGGRTHEVVYGSIASMISSGGLPLGTKLRLGSTYLPFLSRHSRALDLHSPEDAAAGGLDAESIADWGVREIDTAFVAALVYPQLGAYYGASPGETSAGFYHILARDGMDVKLYGIRGGVGEVPARLAERIEAAGGEVRTGLPVTSVRLTAEGAVVASEAGEKAFDAVVAAVPAPVVLDIVEGLPILLRDWLGAVRYRPTLSLALLLDRPVGPRFFGLSFPEGQTNVVAAVAVQENKGVDLVPSGRGLLLVLPTPEAVPSLIDLDSRQVHDRMLPEVIRALPRVQQHVVRARVYRWPIGTPIMYPGYLGHLGAFRASNLEGSLPLVLAGDYLYGPSAEGAVSAALDAVRRLETRLGQ